MRRPFTRSGPWRALACAAVASVATAGEPTDDDARIEVLRAAIARDKARLQELLIEPTADVDGSPVIDPELREIANRLPRLQQELRVLERSQREPLPVEGEEEEEPGPTDRAGDAPGQVSAPTRSAIGQRPEEAP